MTISAPVSSSSTPLSPIRYHRDLTRYLRTHEKALWNWFSETRNQIAYGDAVRLELLKTTYRLNRESEEILYLAGERALDKLGLKASLTFYQSQHDQSVVNASVCCLPNEAHVVLSGPVLETLNDAEMLALIGHELGHFKLRLEENGDFAVADRILDAGASDPRSEPSHVFSAMRFRLYAEIYADRCAWIVSGDVNAVVGCLVKVSTGLKEVNAESYIAQANEIFSKNAVSTQGATHPESFIRVRALAKWIAGDADTESDLCRMIEGPVHLEKLDLTRQLEMQMVTRELIDALFARKWMRSEPALAHARLMFHDYVPPAVKTTGNTVRDTLNGCDETVRDYFCCLMLDFATADPALDEVPLAHALDLAEQYGFRDRLEELANKELRVTKKALARIRQESAEMLAKAENA